MLGGLTVLFFLPAAVSTAHAALAEIFFCLTVAIALFTSPRWIDGYGARDCRAPVDDSRRCGASRRPRRCSIYIQILIGATMRHTGAGLAIPDFPLMFGHLVPPHWDPKIAIHFAHRVGALVVALAVARYGGAHLVYHQRAPPRADAPGGAARWSLVAVQVTLGALTVLTRRDVWINSLHVVCGALVLTTSLVLTLRSWRVRFAAGTVPVERRRTEPARRPLTRRTARTETESRA